MYKSLKKCMGLKKSVSALLAAMLISLPGASSLAMESIMPYSEVWGGETGTAYTVVDGSGEIQPFQVDLIGKMDGGKGGSRSIMARASGALIEQTGGVLQGMSGSPIYVEGRLVGALAAGIKDMAPYTFFITPIEDMLPLWSLPDNKNKGRLATFDLKKYQEDKAKKAEEEAKKDAKAEGESAAEEKQDAPETENAAAEADEAGKAPAAAEAASEEKPEAEAAEPAPEETAGAEKSEAGEPVAEMEKEPKSTLFFSGFNTSGLDYLKKKLDPKGELSFVPMGIEAGQGFLATRYNAELQPGSPVGVAVVCGDFSVGATGTVTAVEGKKVLAFGHSFLHKGNVNYFMTDASVVGTISGPAAGMKIANMGSIIGRVNQDRETGVAGILGEFPSVVPMKIRVEDKTLGRQDNYGVRIAYDEDYLPQLTAGVAYAAVAKTSDTTAGATAKIDFTIRTDALPGGKVTRSNMFYGAEDVGQNAVGELAQAMNLICNNKDKESDIVDVQADISLEEGRHTASLVSATPEKMTAAPGETVNFKTTIKPYRGEKQTLTIPYTVPKLQQEGTLHLDVRGGGFIPVTAAMLLQQVGLETADEEGKNQKVADRLQNLMDTPRNNEIIIAPGAGQPPTSEKEQRRMIREAAKAAKAQAEEDQKNHKVEFLKDKKKDNQTRFETEYIIDNVIHATLKVERP
ncbi:SpoIVB peptidase S55 domain-containing protein [Selenomonas sp. AB3002]|uniref:SpoIVB peptidase S55 domain-containing protein n=1 Tax=Selenomonas sp. AB3002 TaxID=1392502 RepID=UPI000AFD8DBD